MKKNLNDTRNKKSLSVRIVRFTFLCCAVLWLVAVTIGLGLYGRALSVQYIRHAYDVAESVSNSVQRGADSVSLSRQVMGIYNSLSEEQREQMGTEEYREYFSAVDVSKGSTYYLLINMLSAYSDDHDDIDILYLAMYDEKHSCLVFIVDPHRIDTYYPGEWESVEPGEAQRFLHWDGKGVLYYISNTDMNGWIFTAGVPLQDFKDGATVAYVLVDVQISRVIIGIAEYAIKITLALFAVTIILSIFIVMHIDKMVVGPINKIAGSAEEYVKIRQDGSELTDVFSELDIHTGDELENLGNVLSDMEHNLTDYEKQVARISADKERINTELELAARIQQSALQYEFPAFPDRTEFDIYATMEPAKVVGGDFYDFFLIDDDHLCIVMADVSDKGIPAALFMMGAKGSIRHHAMTNKSPAKILLLSNSAIRAHNTEMMFVTVWLGILEISTGKLTAANAGHEYPAVRLGGAPYALLKKKHSFAIGAIPKLDLTEYEMDLMPGDRIFLYTDGLPEATDPDGNWLGYEEMINILNRYSDASPCDLLGGVRKELDTFVREAEQFDDLTMLGLEYKGVKENRPQ